jgi:nucleotide-binding universal stress UspA family protein
VLRVQEILLATDFSPYSNQAYFHAVALAESNNAGLHIAHVLTPSPAPPLVLGEGLPPEPVGEADGAAYWRGQLEQIRPLNPRIPVRHTLLVGDPADEILRYAADARCDLIVLGTHGRTGLARLLMGSVAERVLRGAPCSVLVVKMPRAVAGPREAEPAAAATAPS